MTLPPTARKPFRLWPRVVRFTAMVAIGFCALLSACQHRLIYFPSPYRSGEPEAFVLRGGKRLDFSTSQGRQAAWLIPPRDGKSVDHLWIVCSGNAAQALGMEDYWRSLPFTGDAFLLVDYPGYGACEGAPHPSDIRESLRISIPMAARELGIAAADLPERACVFGHSLGCAAGLIAAEEFKLRRAVLCSPFTSTMEMAQVMLKLPLGFLVHHRFDNRAGMESLRQNQGHAWIFHGADDAIIPADMSRSLAAEFPGTVTFCELPHAGHNDMVTRGHARIAAAMGEARRQPAPHS